MIHVGLSYLKKSLLANFCVAETTHQMIIHHASCLHESIADRRTAEGEASRFQILAHHFCFKGLGR